MPLNITSIPDAMGTQSEIIMLATTVYEFSRTVIERIVPKRIRQQNIPECETVSIELRRYLAAEIAYKAFEQRKERALTENHRAGLIR